jgi:hypothetical protein
VTNPAEIIKQTRVPGTHSVLFLGCFEKRVTVYSQQVRAMNLAAAMLEEDLLRTDGRVAIVGGGIAGLTAAVALQKAAPDLRAIHVFEKRSEVLQLQQNSNRYLHPHNYDWPQNSAAFASAGLPFMNWKAGPAREVQGRLREEFDGIARTSQIQLYPNACVTEVKPFERSSARVITSGGAPSDIYDAVILSIGFGLERALGPETASYWTSSEMESPILPSGPHSIFVSGNGDGGLVDFMAAALAPMSHQQICDLLTGLDIPLAKAELRLIEEQAWAAGSTIDLYAAYQARVLPLVPPPVWATIRDHLRPDVTVRLHTNEARLFKRNTAVLNRFGCALLLEADRQFGLNALQAAVGVPFEGDPTAPGAVTLAGEAPFQPYRRYLRLGPDDVLNLAPFKALRDQMPPETFNPVSGARPGAPRLSAEAIALFGSVSGPDGTVSPATTDAKVLALRIGSHPDGGLAVVCDLTPDRLGEVWEQSLGVVADTDLRVRDTPALPGLLARLCGHAPVAVLHAQDRRGWEDHLRYALRGEALPADIDLGIRVETARDLDPIAAVPSVSEADYVAAAHAALDAKTLSLLDTALYDVLAQPHPAPCGWNIEAHLRSDLWTQWGTWHQVLLADPAGARRFMALLAHVGDYHSDGVDALIGVGPKTLRSTLLKAAVFALAFSVCAGHPMTPAVAPPGNLHSTPFTGHACGVSWIEGRVVSSKVVNRPWTAMIVLLAELRMALPLLSANMRMDEQPGDRPRIGEVATIEHPLILAADDAFVDALEAGRSALATYFEAILASRAAAAQRMIEVQA